MAIGNYYATPENDPYEGERSLHINNTRDRGNKIDFWMFVPKEKSGSIIRCGTCKTPLDGLKHCPRCYG